MPSNKLKFTLVQSDIVWEDRDANLLQYEKMLEPIGSGEIVVLPEMFATGFSMKPELYAEPMQGTIHTWMQQMAREKKCILTGSVIIEEEGKYYNRMLWVLPNGQYGYYDKRHLFAYAGEDKHYSPGNKRLIVQVNGWKIALMICYDLRFPVWLRNTPQNPYDVLLIVANWPERRSMAWKTLLQARAIENQCYVIGVNRVGIDGNQIMHSGDSSVWDPMGNLCWQETGKVAVHTLTLDKEVLQASRTQFPFLQDAYSFILPNEI